MLRSMFAGVTGMRAHQLMLDVVSNNIANVNTGGYKASRVQFADALSETLRNAAGTTASNSAVNPLQVGLGVVVKSTTAQFSTGSFQLTDRPFDSAISGAGFYIVNVKGEELYTRSGSFNLDSTLTLVDGSGGRVQGWMADNAGQLDSVGAVRDINLADYQSVPAQAATSMKVRGSLSVSTNVGTVIDSLAKVVDGLGIENTVTVRYEKVSDNNWTMKLFDDTNTQIGGTVALQFDPASGHLVSPTTDPSFTLTPTTSGADPFTFSVDLGAGNDGLHQYGGTTVVSITQDGRGPGQLRDYGIAADGVISGRYSNGVILDIARIAVATFGNNEGLKKVGEAHYRSSQVSGEAVRGIAGEGNVGDIKSGVLEMSNVDLGREFTDLILAQRGFQANSRIITTSDEMVQELVNLKR